MTCILCPGQGAQQVGMGHAWAQQSPTARDLFAQADAILEMNLSALCFEGPADALNRTDIAQPALFVAGVASYQAGLNAGTFAPPTVAAGLSLGEFTALHLAGCFDFEQGVKLVRLRGQAMQRTAEASASSMVALTGDVSEASVQALCDKVNVQLPTGAVLVPANYNSPMQVVVSGTLDACERVVPEAQAMGFKATPLTVAGAFHSPLMQPAAIELAQALEDIDLQPPTFPVLSNVTGKPHIPDARAIRQRLVEQVTMSVRWTECVQHAVGLEPSAFIELAPGKVLAGLMRRIDKAVKVTSLDTPA